MKPRTCYSVSHIILVICALALVLGHPAGYVSAVEGFPMWNQYGQEMYEYPPHFGSIIPGRAPLIEGESLFTIAKRLTVYPGGARRFTWIPSQVYQFLATTSVPWIGMPPEGFMTQSPAVVPVGWPADLLSTSGLWPFYSYQWGMNRFYQTTGVSPWIYGREPK